MGSGFWAQIYADAPLLHPSDHVLERHAGSQAGPASAAPRSRVHKRAEAREGRFTSTGLSPKKRHGVKINIQARKNPLQMFASTSSAAGPFAPWTTVN